MGYPPPGRSPRPVGRGEVPVGGRGRLGALADILSMLTETLVIEHQLAPLLDRIAEAVVTHTGADEAWLWMCEPRGERLVVVAGVGADRSVAIGRSRGRGEGFVGRAWELEGTLYIADGAEHPATRPFCARGTEVVALPLRGEGEISGLLTVSACPRASERRLEHEIELLESVAELASIAIANARRMEVSRAELQRTRALTRLGRLLSSTGDPRGELDAVCLALTEALDIALAGLYLVDDDGVRQRQAVWSSGADGAVRIMATPAAWARESIAQWCHGAGESATIGRGVDDPRESARVHAMRRELDIGATCCVPIVFSGFGAGSIVISRSRAQPDFQEVEIELCGAVADLLSIALERHSLSVALEHRAYHDSLTGLPNRLRFERELGGALTAEDPHGTSGAVMFLDLDGFKAINDSLGHAAGDTLLQQVARRFSEGLGVDELLARLGGDEFAVLVRRFERPSDVVQLARRLVESLEAPFVIDGERVRIGASVGIGHYPQDGRSVDELLGRADGAMYRAKQAGKGRVVCSTGMADTVRAA